MNDELSMEFAERISRLEELAKQGKEERGEMKTSMDDLHGEFRTITDTLNSMREDLAKYRGFWGGALLVVSAVWAFLELAGGYFMEKFKGGG